MTIYSDLVVDSSACIPGVYEPAVSAGCGVTRAGHCPFLRLWTMYRVF